MSFDQPIPNPLPAPVAPNGEAAAAREVRRMARLVSLERLRGRADRISEKLCDHIEGTLPAHEAEPFARIADPTLAFTRVATAIRRIAALEEQIDEDEEAREHRRAEEAAKRAKEAAEAERLPAERRIHLRASRRIAREAARDAIRARDGNMEGFRREALLDDLTADLDDLDYADDMETVLEQIGQQLDAIIGPPKRIASGSDEKDDDDDGQPFTIADACAALAKFDDALMRVRQSRESG